MQIYFLNELPLLEGASECFKSGIVSTLQPQNKKAHHYISNYDQLSDLPDLEVLFDPQTAGGLIAGVSADIAEECIKALATLGYVHASIIGEVIDEQEGMKLITLV